MTRFVRSALLPLVVLAALAWIAVRVLHSGPSAKKATYSQAIHYAERNQLARVVFRPRTREIDATLRDGETIAVNYPTAQAAAQFQNLLHQKHIRFQSES